MASTTSSADTANQYVLGAILNFFAMGIFAVQDIIVKVLSDRYSVWQFSLMRSGLAFLVIALFLLFAGRFDQFRMKRPKYIFLRGTFSFGSLVFFFLSLASLPITTSVALLFLAPLLVAALSGPMLREKVGIHRWSAVLLGFIGLLMIIRPDIHSVKPAIYLGLCAGFLYAFRLMSVRMIGMTDSSATISMYSFLVGTVFTLAFAILFAFIEVGDTSDPSLAFLNRDWVALSGMHLLVLSVIGVTSAIGHILSVGAYQVAPTSFVGAFEYTYFIWRLGV